MFEKLFPKWGKSHNKPELTQNIEDAAVIEQCFTYIYSQQRGQKINLEDYFSGKMNGTYKTLVLTDNGRANVDKCMLYKEIATLMKMLSGRHAPPSDDMYILRFNCCPEKVVAAIINDQFHTTIIEAYDYLDLWRQQNNQSYEPVQIFSNPHVRSQQGELGVNRPK